MGEDAARRTVKHAVGVIKRGGDHLLSLIEGTLDIARIESGKLTLDVKPVRLGELLRQITGLIENEARGKALKFIADIDPALPEAVRADERRVRQILINVLGNAVKFTSTGRVTFKVRYAREIASIDITDTGPGIPQDELDKIFEPFARGSSAAGNSASGTGLGLTVSKMLTDLMGGEMMVQSQLGLGTNFRIRLFLPQVRMADAMRTVPRGQRTGYVGERQRVWVVDNEDADRGLLVRILEPLGFEVTSLASGLECLTVLRTCPAALLPHAIFMDLAMPGLDGWGTLRAIRVDGLSEAPVAIVSANAFDKALDNDVGITSEDFIVKPVRVPELLDWLGRRLQLTWIEVARPVEASAALAHVWGDGGKASAIPSLDALRMLEDQIHAGYIRGVHKVLDQVAVAEPHCDHFVQRLRGMAKQFQLDAMAGLVRDSLVLAQPRG
jgi:CheY-like chemotaxis protein